MQGARHQLNFRGAARVRNFAEKYQDAPSNTVVESVLALPDEVDFLSPDVLYHATTVMSTCLNQISSVREDHRSLVANHLAMLCCVFPDLYDSARLALEHSGAVPRVIMLPSQAVEAVIVMGEKKPPKWGIFVFAQCALIIFKNISRQSYAAFIQKRNTALMAEIGFLDPDAPQVYTCEEAKVVNAYLAKEDSLRQALLMSIIRFASDKTPLGRACAYLMTIIAWTEMSSLTFIYDALLTTKSPVLNDPRVSSEVLNLQAAFADVCAHQYPQFYKILASPIATKKLDRAKFPILLSVAQRLMSQRQNTVSQFVMPSGRNDMLVEQLVHLHNTSETQRETQTIRGAVAYLTDFDDEEAREVIGPVQQNQ